MSSFKHLILKRYINASLEVRKKGWILVLTSVILGGVAGILTVVMAVTGAAVVAVLTTVLFLFCAFTIFLVYRGAFSAAANGFIVVLFVIMYCAIKFDQYIDSYETYVLAGLGLFLLLITCMIGTKRIQPIVVTVLNTAAILSVYFIDVLPAEGGIVTTLHIQNIATSLIITIGGGLVGLLILHLLSELVSQAERKTRETADRFTSLDTIVSSHYQESVRSGESLAGVSRRTVDLIQQSDSNLNRIRERNDNLNSLITASTSFNEETVTAARTLLSGMAGYSQAVASVSASIEEINTSIENINKGTRERRERIDLILDEIHAVTDAAGTTQNTIQKIGLSTKNMIEMLTLITDVSSRTNLLAMNASIEAAHAGDKGKGFAVVAQEIRKLANETAKSASTIKDALRKSVAEIDDAITSGEENRHTFSRIDDEVVEIGRLFDEIVLGVSESAAGIGSILTEIETIRTASGEIDAAVNKVAGMSEKNKENNAGVVRESMVVSEALRELSGISKNIRAEAEQVQAQGYLNIEKIEDFNRRIIGVKAVAV